MAADDLNAPGQSRGDGRAVWYRRFECPSLTNCIYTAVGIAVAVTLGWVVFVDDPFGGEPVAIVALDRPTDIQSDSGESIGIRPTVDSREADPLPSGHALPPADIVISDPSSGLRPPVARTSTGNGEAIVQEAGKHGPLPVVSPDGRRPADVYSQFTMPIPPDVPRIVILVGGMGLSTTATEAAIDKLPPQVTLAFAPYGDEIDRLTSRARQAGHELVLQVPLEPYDYPDNDPGPYTLLTGLSDAQNRDRLHWVMSRFTGYVGVLNYMGARFLASDEALRPVLGELRDRGLIYVDDGVAPGSTAARVSSDVGLPFAEADLTVDAIPTKEAIAERLAALEEKARADGVAVGVASGLPVTIDALAEWSAKLDERGIAVVPVTAAVSGGQT